jgi:hypothetical protein
VNWPLVAVTCLLGTVALYLAVCVGELLARRDVPIPGERPTWLQRVVESVRWEARRARARYWRYIRGRRSP